MFNEIAVAKRFLCAATAEMPDHFRGDEPALMTLDEYIQHRNPEDKSHSSEAYKTTLKSLNEYRHSRHIGTQRTWTESRPKTFDLRQHPGYFEVRTDRDRRHLPIAYIKDGILFYEDKEATKIREDWAHLEKEFRIPIKTKKQVKYLGEVRKHLDETARENIKEYPNLLRRFQNKGEYFEIRSEEPLSENDRQSIVIMHDGYIVGIASDEWGATLLRIAEEYQRRGLGNLLGRIYTHNNPTSGSGGFTPAGYANATRMWEARVKEFLQRGWYSQLIQEGRISKDKVRDILKDVSGKTTPSKMPQLQKSKEKPKVLVMIDGPLFVIYDMRYFEDPEDKYIYAYGFFRSSMDKTFLYTIDYDRKFERLAYLIAFQMAKDMGEKVYVGQGYTDFLELDKIPEIDIVGDYAELRSNVVDLAKITGPEKQLRRVKDPYDQFKTMLIENAESKWK